MKPIRDPGYREYLRYDGCCPACLAEFHRAGTLNVVDYAGNCDPAHTENNGMGSKGPDSSCAPLCRRHHREYDSGRKAFEAKYGIDMKAEAAKWYAKYLKWREQTRVVTEEPEPMYTIRPIRKSPKS